jgi:DNA-binding HxlR family transcriptional regulator
VRRTRFDDWDCPIARTTDLLGDWWTPLVLRQAFRGERRFDQIQRSIGIPKAVLAARLERLVSEGILDKVPYEEHPPRFEYRLTPKGRALWDVLAAMWRWGSDWSFDGEAPGVFVDAETGEEVVPQVVDAATGQPLDPRRLRIRPNPRAGAATS